MLYIEGKDYDAAAQVQLALGVLGFVDHYKNCDICDNPEANECFAKYNSADLASLVCECTSIFSFYFYLSL